ncbi:PREDICTED: uncharacterized protein LOC109236638 [Nicotiana attenuata]|uniref:uncharacterized protein LOC109236638 n=1 Tax=Nicotiana attenuata TaxID=49451 RepID=UPI000904A2E2|nr:PREDICTED: uncharacterized protein LOC109236638 [Nicotiana attenuata]
MTTNSETKLSMKLLIDTKARKVVFAEAEKKCVDFLFHILSLPVGSVVRLLKEKGMNGCLSNLYNSIENLNETYLLSNVQAKDILLKPRSSVGISSVPYRLLNDGTVEKIFYKCSSSSSTKCSYSSHYVTDGPSAVCPNCRNSMSAKFQYVAPPIVEEAVAAIGVTITGFDKLNVKDAAVLQEKVVNIGVEEALKFLKASFESKTVLTSVFLSHVKAEK